MKRKYILGFLLIFVCLITITGCGKKETNKETATNEEEVAKTPASILVNAFEEEIKKEKDLYKVVEKLTENKVIETKMIIEEDGNYLPGFDEELENYDSFVKAQPAISTIPFIFYVFETEKPDKLADELKEKANLRWNICTEADEMKITTKDNYVFFVMAPSTFEE